VKHGEEKGKDRESLQNEHDRISGVITSPRHTTIWLYLSGRKYIPDGFMNWSNEVQLNTLNEWCDSVLRDDGRWFAININ